jgi:hypothetical protein
MSDTAIPTLTRTVLGTGEPCYTIITEAATLCITDLGILAGRPRQWAFTLFYRTTVMAEAIVPGDDLAAGVAAAVRTMLDTDAPTHRVPTLPAYRAFEALAALDVTTMERALGAPALHGIVHEDGYDGRYRLYTSNHLSFDALPAYDEGGPRTAPIDGWTVSTTITSIGLPGHAVSANDGRVTVGAHRGGFPGSKYTPERHELDGTDYPTQRDAERALYEAGLTAFMVYERDAARYGLNVEATAPVADNKDAAIRAHLNDYMQGDSPQAPIEAVERVLDECARCERGGTVMTPGIVRDLIAATLNV